MSLLRDYLEKTTLQEGHGRDTQVPPMLRQDKKRGMDRFTRLMPVMAISFIILFFSGYVFKTSFQEITAQPQTAFSGNHVAGAVTSAPVFENPSTPAPLNTFSVEVKPAVTAPVSQKKTSLPVKSVKVETVVPVELTQQTSLMPRVKSQELLQTEEKLQAAMEAKEPEQKADSEKVIEPIPDAKPPVAGAEDYFKLGLAAQKKGNLNQAVGFYRKVLTLEPGHSRALLNLSALHIKTGNTARAKIILKKLHAQEPENVDAMVNLGILFLQEKDYNRAEILFEKALDLQGHNTTVLYNLAYLNQLQNRLDRAGDLFSRVASIDRNNTRALLANGSIREKQNKLAEAVGYYVQALTTKEVKNSEPLRSRIENRIRLLQQIKANADYKTINPEETHD